MFKKLLTALFALIAATAFAAVDVNKASQAELDSIKGIGPAIAGKIIDERKKGSFKDWADFVDRVKGVGEGNAAKFSAEGLTVNGQGFKGAAPAAPAAKTEKAAPAAKADKATAAVKTEAKPAAPAPAASAAAPAPAPAAKADAKATAKADAKAEDAKKSKKDKKAADKAEAAASAAAAKK